MFQYILAASLLFMENLNDFVPKIYFTFEQKLILGMNTLFQNGVLEEVIARMDNLTPQSQREWGKMNVSQMMAHCTETFEMATGRKNTPQLFIGKILGPLLKGKYLSEKPFDKNSPTGKDFIISNERDFEIEKQKLKAIMNDFVRGGLEKVTRHPHGFFGHLTPEQWGISMYKHMDHHLRQFGV